MNGDEIRQNISKNIVKYREKAQLSQKELARRLNTTPSRVSNWEQGANCPTIDILFEVCKILKVSINDIYGIYPESEITLSYDEQEHIRKYRRLDDMGRQHVDTVLDWEADRSAAAASFTSQITELTGQVDSLRQQQSHSRRIAYYYGVSAGTGQVVFDDVYSESITIPNGPQYSRVAYAVKVSGHSMEPLYKDGSCLLVEPTCEIEPGEIGIFNIDGQAFVKKLGQTELISLNPDYDNIPLTEDSRCMGHVTGEYHID